MFRPILLVIGIASAFGVHCHAEDSFDTPKTLLTRVFAWQYPGSELGTPQKRAQMSGGAKYDKNGNNTVSSVQCKATFATADPADKVLEFYKSKLVHAFGESRPAQTIEAEEVSGRSVTFQSVDNNRPLAMHVIMVNDTREHEGTIASHVSTTLVISRVQGEDKTFITWSQFQEYATPKPK